MSNQPILIVDDEPTLLTVLRSVLEDVGYEVFTSTSAEEALVLLKQRSFALAIVDKNLPIMNGIDLAQAARRLYGVRTLMITGYPSTPSLIDAINAGIMGYLVKPFESLDAAVSAVQRTLAHPNERAQIDNTALLDHLNRQTRSVSPSAVIVAKDAQWRTQAATALGAQTRCYEKLNLALADASDNPPQYVGADDVDALIELIQCASDATAWYFGPRLNFSTAITLMRLGGTLVKPLTEVGVIEGAAQ